MDIHKYGWMESQQTNRIVIKDMRQFSRRLFCIFSYLKKNAHRIRHFKIAYENQRISSISVLVRVT